MRPRGPSMWVWAEALELLLGAERQRPQLFSVANAHALPCWEPSVDVYQRGPELTLLVALPGVNAGQVEVDLDEDRLVVSGERPIPEALCRSSIHRLEIPYGRFERRVTLPAGRFRLVKRFVENGCLVLVLHATEE